VSQGLLQRVFMSPCVMLISLLAVSLLWVDSQAQTCLSSPLAVLHNKTRAKDIEWEAIPGVDNAFQRTVTFDAFTKSWEDVNALITTRLFDGNFPSETWRFEAGKLYEITVVNNLGPESPDNPTDMNVYKDGNTTNVHTHGLHLSGMGDSDNVFTKIGPGESHTYRYNIPCNHAGGTFWWHPHHHGASHLQVGGGAAGALIIEDDAEREGLPDWYTEMEELIFFVTHLHLAKYTKMKPDWDETWSYGRYNTGKPPGSVNTWFVNGEYLPTVCQTAGEWTKFRFAHIETTEKARIYYFGEGECTQYLLARDGVMVHGKDDTDMPRSVGHGVFMAHSSRADVAVSCPGHSVGEMWYNIWTYDDDDEPITIAYLHVTGTATEPATDLTPFTPIRPEYLENLMPGKYEGDLEYQQYEYCERFAGLEYCTDLSYLKDMEVSGATIVNQKFDGETNYMAYMDIDKVHIWEVTAEPTTGEVHPLHIHINHFQLINSTLGELTPTQYTNWIDVPAGYQEEGDWIDTIWGPGYITFKTDVYAGTVTLHCHVLIHEDQGAMGTAYIRNGCDGDYNDVGDAGSCHYEDTCGQFGTDPPTAETKQPTKGPSASPTNPVPTTSPTQKPTFGDPTRAPTKSPVSQQTKTDLQLVLRGTLATWYDEAQLYTEDASMSTLGEQCIRDAIDLATYPQLDAVTITVTDVTRGSIYISYTLTAWDADLLTLATNNVIANVAAGTKWSAHTASSNVFKFQQHIIITDQTFLTEDEGKWWQSSIVQAIVLASLVALCCLCVGCIWYRNRRSGYDKDRQNMEMQKLDAMRKDTVDVFTTAEETPDAAPDAPAGGTELTGNLSSSDDGTAGVVPSLYHTVQSNSGHPVKRKQKDAFKLNV